MLSPPPKKTGAIRALTFRRDWRGTAANILFFQRKDRRYIIKLRQILASGLALFLLTLVVGFTFAQALGSQTTWPQAKMAPAGTIFTMTNPSTYLCSFPY